MASFRNALFLVALVVVVVGVNSAAFQQSDYKQRPSVWSAKMSPLDVMLSLWRKDVNIFRVDSVKGCCMSNVWAGTLFGETWVDVGGKKRTIRTKIVLNIDMVNNRGAQDITSSIENVTQSVIVLCDKSGGTVYSFVKATQQCKKEQFSQCPIDPHDIMCFPSNGSLVESFHLGAGSGALSTQTWGYQHRDSYIEEVTDVILTPDNCVPVFIADKTHTYDSPKTTQISGTLFTNVTLSIPDPSVFTPPPYCDKEEGETLTFDHLQDFDITAIFKRFALFR